MFGTIFGKQASTDNPIKYLQIFWHLFSFSFSCYIKYITMQNSLD